MKLSLISLLSCATLVGAQEAVAQSEGQRSEPCVPAALLVGADEVVGELQEQLLLLGVSHRAATGCPVVRAQVARIEEGISVELQDSSGRTASIRLSDANIAATWIDSWLQEELGAPLLAIRSQPVMTATPPSASPLRVDSAPIEPSVPRAARRYQAGLSYESSTSSDKADWQGLRAQACVQVGPTCLGVLARISENQSKEFMPDGFSSFSQSAIDALAQVEFPIAIGRSTLSPRLALGASMLSTKRKSQAECGMVDEPPPPGCDEAFGQQDGTRASLAPQIETGLSLSVPLASAIHLQLGASLNVRPLGQPEQAVEGPELPPACELDDPACEEFDSPALQAMPRDPDRFLRLSIGLKVQL